MKAITLTEPWATLMLLQKKRNETRSWRLPQQHVGREIAIHSAKGCPAWAKELRDSRRFCEALGDVDPELNRGHVLCVVRFVKCVSTDVVRGQLDERELAFGDYDDGRYAWISEFVRAVEPKVAATGHLGIWDWQ